MGLQYTTITVTLDCGTQSCISGVTKTITVANLLNRFSTKPLTGTISASTLDDQGYAFDSLGFSLDKTSLPLALSISLQGQFSSLSRSSNVVSEASLITVEFKTSVRLLPSSTITVYIPADSFTKNPTTALSCIDPSTSATVSCSL